MHETEQKAPSILVVEDESIVAMDMERRLRGLGYHVVGRVLTGKDAVQQDDLLHPDIVLMDIHLKGDMDGIEASTYIRSKRDVPIIYITAYSDDKTLERAKATQPYGYILKPFQEREIHSVIEMALYKHHAETELKRAKREAEEGLRARNEFLANMSHEFRTPINSILGMATLAKERSDSSEVGEYLDLLIESGKGLLDMVSSVLDYAKIESDRFKLVMSNLNVSSMVKKIRERFAYQIAQSDVDFSITVAPGVPKLLWCDEEKYYQIILNLVSNALKFTSRGEVSVTISAGEKIDQAGGSLLLKVVDTGVGIAKDQQDHIFRAFTQVDGSATRTFGGTGLGLTIVKQFVDQVGGSIELTSDTGKGTEVVVKLPVRISTGAEHRIGHDEGSTFPDTPINMSDFAEHCRRLLREQAYEQIEHEAYVIKNHFAKLGYGKVEDDLLRVILGTRKRSEKSVLKALILLDEDTGQSAESEV